MSYKNYTGSLLGPKSIDTVMASRNKRIFIGHVQLSVMRIFEQILSDKQYRQQPHGRELINLCTLVTRNLFKRMLNASTKETSKSMVQEEQAKEGRQR